MTPRRYELTDFEWSIIAPLLPNKPRGVPRADDRLVLNGIYWRLRTGSPWADIPERYVPPTTCYNRFVRWRRLLRIPKLGGDAIECGDVASLIPTLRHTSSTVTPSSACRNTNATCCSLNRDFFMENPSARPGR